MTHISSFSVDKDVLGQQRQADRGKSKVERRGEGRRGVGFVAWGLGLGCGATLLGGMLGE